LPVLQDARHARCRCSRAASARTAFHRAGGLRTHRPESTLLYQLVEQHYPAFRELRAMAGRSLPDYIEEEFDAYLKCGRLEEGLPARALRALPRREAGGIQLQEARVLSLVRREAHGRDRGAAGR
jgi:hypothetical protein